MKKKEKRFVLILIIIAIVAIVFIVVRNNNMNNTEQAQGQQSQTAQQGTTNPNANTSAPEGEFTKDAGNGVVVNTSDKLSQTKTFEGYEISDIRMSKTGNTTLILAKIKNTTNTAKPFQMIKFTLLDKDGKEIQTISCGVKELEPGETATLSTSASYNFVNAYDFTISK